MALSDLYAYPASETRAAPWLRANMVVSADGAAALAERGYRRLLTEGGPRLLTQFTAAGLLDDLCLTISPVLEGGWAGRILTAPEAASDGAPGQVRPETADGPQTTLGLRLAHVLEDQGSLLCRYLRDTG